jgi:ribosomal protein L11 methylase PrmA
MILLLNGLNSYVAKLRSKKNKTTWDDYYSETILSDAYLKEKTKLVQAFVSKVPFSSMIDLGANDGHFSLLFKNTATQIVAVDADANCINELYLKIKSEKIKNILPLINTLNTPSPAIGWNNKERAAFGERMKADMIFALALVHHLAIACNVPLQLIADWLAPMGKYLLIEFVPKEDEKVQLLLQNREDIFDDYAVTNFEAVFSKKYNILVQEKITGTERILYLMEKK